MRIALGLSYDGSRYHGWQSQPGLLTVQEQVEKALSEIAKHPIKVVCAGRTDTAVHAIEQVVHFETNAQRPDRAWIHGVNSHLPKDVTIQWKKLVDDEFHARFSAVARQYRYYIYNSTLRPALFAHNVSWQYRYLDVELMREASKFLQGENDFTSLRSIDCQAHSPVRTIHEIDVTRKGNIILIDVTANAFLHHMVRNIAGVLISVGMGRNTVSWIREVLDAKDRCAAGVTAPPYGLYLSRINYPEKFDIKHVNAHSAFILDRF